MKNFLDDFKAIFKDPTNRNILRILKWILILLCIGAIPGGAGIILALVLIFGWKLPK